MRTTVEFAVSLVISMAVVVIADECHNVCADVKKAVSFKSGCSSFRNSLPRPKVARHCQEGFKAAVDLNCYDACVNGGGIQAFVIERRLDEVCNGALRDTPRPLCHDSCVRGYQSGVADMSARLVKRMAEVDPSALSTMRGDIEAHRTAQNAHAVAAAGAAEAADTRGSRKSTFADDLVTKLVEKAGAEMAVQDNLDVKASKADDNSVGAKTDHEQDRHIEQNVEEPFPSERDTNEPENDSATVDDIHSELREQNEETAADMEVDEEGLVLSLPITVDNVQQELMIFDGDEPIEIVLAFCEKNMPDEGAACTDQLLRVVQDKLGDYGKLEGDVE